MDLSKMQDRWPDGTAEIIGTQQKRKDFGSAHPVISWRGRIVAAIVKQLEDKGDRDEAIATLVIISICILGLYLLCR